MIVRRCSSKGAFEAFPEKQVKVDLSSLKNGFVVIVETPVLVIVKDVFEVSVFKDGKLLIKDCGSLEAAEEQAAKVYRKLFEKV